MCPENRTCVRHQMGICCERSSFHHTCSPRQISCRSQPGLNPGPAVKAQSPNHWPAREFKCKPFSGSECLGVFILPPWWLSWAVTHRGPRRSAPFTERALFLCWHLQSTASVSTSSVPWAAPSATAGRHLSLCLLHPTSVVTWGVLMNMVKVGEE